MFQAVCPISSFVYSPRRLQNTFTSRERGCTDQISLYRKKDIAETRLFDTRFTEEPKAGENLFRPSSMNMASQLEKYTNANIEKGNILAVSFYS